MKFLFCVTVYFKVFDFQTRISSRKVQRLPRFQGFNQISFQSWLHPTNILLMEDILQECRKLCKSWDSRYLRYPIVGWEMDHFDVFPIVKKGELSSLPMLVFCGGCN